MEVLKGLGRLFYIIDPKETSFKEIDEIPDYVTQATPYFITLIVLEYFCQIWKNKSRTRLNDGVVSLSHGMYLGFGQMIFRGLESYFYVKVYENWRIYELPWDSPVTWYIAAIGADFGYYWLHRAAHEINILWAEHQVHHSSEEYNLTTALRQSALQILAAWIVYMPMAFFVPPSICLIHQQFNLLYQFWIHTEVIDSLGPLEYIFNTPKHHRIHHGSNRYCLDKNYAGVLIIWDRMFGTFQEEKPDEKIVYGLVDQVRSFEPFYLQFFYFGKIWEKMKGFTRWSDKTYAAIKGPGWFPGTPRLGDLNQVPVVQIREKYDVVIPTWKNVYAGIHFFMVIVAFDTLSKQALTMSQSNVLLSIAALIISLTSIGYIFEGKRIAAYLETFRNSTAAFLIWKHLSMESTGTNILLGFFLASVLIWIPTLLLDKEPTKVESTKRKKKM